MLEQAAPDNSRPHTGVSPPSPAAPGEARAGASDVVLQPELLVVHLAGGAQVVELVHRRGDPAVGVEQRLADLDGERALEGGAACVSPPGSKP